jgi:rubrerythrin
VATAKQAEALERARAALAEKREAAKSTGLDVLATRVEILWTERENGLARQRTNEPYDITYRCRECGTLIDGLAPQFWARTGRVVKCPNPVHGGTLTELDY